MNTTSLLNKAKALDGISLSEWNKLKTVVDESFKKRTRELEGEIKLSCTNDVENTIRSLFG